MAITKLPTPKAADASYGLGKDYFLEINTGATEDAPTWTPVGGQKSTSLKMTADEIDASHKTSGGYKSTLPGLKSWSMDADALVVLNNDGAAALEYAFLNNVRVHCRLSSATNKKAYTGWASVTSYSLDTSHTDVATISVSLTGVGPLAVATI